MTTEFSTRSKALQEIVLGYFRSCDGEAVVSPKPDMPGAVDVELRGSLASRFETVSVPQQGQSGVRLLRLLFDREFAAIATGYELIAPRSHVLRLIRNELSGRAEYSRSGAIFNLDSSFSDLSTLGIVLHFATPTVECHYVPRRFYAVRYKLRQEAYERNEDTLLIVVDPACGAVLPTGEAAKLAEVNLVDFDRAPYKDELPSFPAANRKSILNAFKLAAEAARERVADVVRMRAIELGSQMKQESERVRRHFAAVSREASQARRLDQERLRDQELQELRSRYKTQSELALMSMQEIVVPTVEYKLLIQDGERVNSLSRPFVFDPLSNVVTTKHCDQCGQSREWAYCSRGVHLDCHKCGTVEECYHENCNKAACDAHAMRCDKCSVVVCATHEQACSYCEDNRRYCDKHIIQSFESRDICPQCAHFCNDCGKAFPPERSTECVVCSGDFCEAHSHECPSCRKHHCVEHGAIPRHRQEIYCHKCLAPCTICESDNLYLKSDLQYCADCGSALCSDHVNTCVSCGKSLCASHSLITEQGTGCTACFTACRTCNSIHHRSDLAHCRICQTGDQGLHCHAHSNTCVLCQQPVCDAHGVEMHDGGLACSACVGSCNQCKEYFPCQDLIECKSCQNVFCSADSAACDICLDSFCNTHLHTLADARRACVGCSDECSACSARFGHDQLVDCHECHAQFCSKDSRKSQFRDEVYCGQHASDFVSCGGCDRQGPASQLEECSLCGLTYCPHCIKKAEGERCIYCGKLQPLKTEQKLGKWHRAVSAGTITGLTEPQRSEILTALTGKDTAFSFSVGESKTHRILSASWRSGFVNYFRRWGRNVTCFVIVREKRSSRVEVRVNKK